MNNIYANQIPHMPNSSYAISDNFVSVYASYELTTINNMMINTGMY